MTTATVLQHAPSVARSARRAGRQLSLGLSATLAVLPLALLAAPAPWHLVGWLYAIAWSLLFIPTTTVTGLIFVEAWRILRGRGPFLLASVMAQARIRQDLMRGYTRHRTAIELAWRVNPLASVAISVLDLAMTARPDVMRLIEADAAELEQVLRLHRVRQPMMELTAEVVHQFDDAGFALSQAC